MKDIPSGTLLHPVQSKAKPDIYFCLLKVLTQLLLPLLVTDLEAQILRDGEERAWRGSYQKRRLLLIDLPDCCFTMCSE